MTMYSAKALTMPFPFCSIDSQRVPYRLQALLGQSLMVLKGLIEHLCNTKTRSRAQTKSCILPRLYLLRHLITRPRHIDILLRQCARTMSRPFDGDFVVDLRPNQLSLPSPFSVSPFLPSRLLPSPLLLLLFKEAPASSLGPSIPVHTTTHPPSYPISQHNPIQSPHLLTLHHSG